MRPFVVLLALICCALTAQAQTTVIRGGKTFVFDTTLQSIVFDLRGGANIHLASDLRCLNDGACKPFQGGSGLNLGLGIGFEQEIDTSLWWIAMAGVDFWQNTQVVRDDAARVRDASNNVVPLVRDLMLESSGLNIDIGAGIQYRRNAWRLWLMPTLLLNAGSPTWRQTATIVSPSNILYPNGTATDETVPTTAIPDAAAMRVAARIGVGRDIDVGTLGMLTPSLQIAYSPMALRAGTSWTDLRGTLGVALRLNADDLPDTVDERRELLIVDTIIARRTGTKDADYVVAGARRIEYDTTRDGYFRLVTERTLRTDTLVMESKTNQITSIVGADDAKDKLVWKRVSGKAKLDGPVIIDTLNVSQVDAASPLKKLGFTFDMTQSESIFMVLPAVFFDAGSAAISDRYRQLRPGDVGEYREYDQVKSQDDVNRDALNILGSRLRRGTSIITVHGHLDTATDGNDCSLALQRALAIKSYFVQVWGIDSLRISVQWDPTNCQPELVSTSTSVKGQQESRRVDISSTSIEQYLPVVRVDRSTTLNPDVTQLPMDALSMNDLTIVEWRYDFFRGKRILWSRQGSGPLETIEFTPPPNTIDTTSKDNSVNVLLTIVSESGGTLDTLQTALKVPLVENVSNQKFKRLSLATFAIRSSTLSERDQELLKVFMSRLDKGDRVEITGYSDDLGERESNIRLSQRRADIVAESAKQLRPDIEIRASRGVGSREFPLGIRGYERPEERFLSRVVQLSIVE